MGRCVFILCTIILKLRMILSDDFFILNSDDLEQQCEEALFEVCDARERYPLQCAKELENCIQLTNEICVSIICKNIIISYILYLDIF